MVAKLGKHTGTVFPFNLVRAFLDAHLNAPHMHVHHLSCCDPTNTLLKFAGLWHYQALYVYLLTLKLTSHLIVGYVHEACVPAK